jgi:hypothetical protein
VNTATTSKALVWRAIANTSYRERPNPQEIIPAAEIHVALIDIMGAVTAMMEESLPKDLQRWAEGLAAQSPATWLPTTQATRLRHAATVRAGPGPDRALAMAQHVRETDPSLHCRGRGRPA